MARLVIAGLPGSGKTSFCRWLVAEHGYDHIDVDTGVPLEIVGRLATTDRVRSSPWRD